MKNLIAVALLLFMATTTIDAQIVNRFRDSTVFFNKVQFDSNIRITQGASNGKVLTSDANGFATWQAGGGGGGSVKGEYGTPNVSYTGANGSIAYVNSFFYTSVGGIVNVSFSFAITLTDTGFINFAIEAPINDTLDVGYNANGLGTIVSSSGYYSGNAIVTGATTTEITYTGRADDVPSYPASVVVQCVLAYRKIN